MDCVAYQAPLSRGFYKQDCWNGLSLPSPGDLSDPGTEPTSLTSPALAGGFFTTSATREALAEVRDACLWGNTSTNTEKAAAVILGLYYEPKTFH